MQPAALSAIFETNRQKIPSLTNTVHFAVMFGNLRWSLNFQNEPEERPVLANLLNLQNEQEERPAGKAKKHGKGRKAYLAKRSDQNAKGKPEVLTTDSALKKKRVKHDYQS